MLSSTFYLVFASTVFMGVDSPQNKKFEFSGPNQTLEFIFINVIFVRVGTKSYGEKFVQCANNDREMFTFILKEKNMSDL